MTVPKHFHDILFMSSHKTYVKWSGSANNNGHRYGVCPMLHSPGWNLMMFHSTWLVVCVKKPSMWWIRHKEGQRRNLRLNIDWLIVPHALNMYILWYMKTCLNDIRESVKCQSSLNAVKQGIRFTPLYVLEYSVAENYCAVLWLFIDFRVLQGDSMMWTPVKYLTVLRPT